MTLTNEEEYAKKWKDILNGLTRRRFLRREIRMLKHIPCSRSLRRIIEKHSLEELESGRGQSLAVFIGEDIRLPFGRPQKFKPRHIDQTRPLGTGGRPQDIVDLLELVDLSAIAREDGMLGEDLDHDAGGAPDVDCGAVLGFAQQEFRGTIPYRDDTVCIVELAALGVEAGEAEVGEFELASVADEDVGGFDVAVEDSPTMEMVETFEELFSEVFLMGVRELEGRVVEEASQVVGEVLKDHEAVILFDHDFL